VSRQCQGSCMHTMPHATLATCAGSVLESRHNSIGHAIAINRVTKGCRRKRVCSGWTYYPSTYSREQGARLKQQWPLSSWKPAVCNGLSRLRGNCGRMPDGVIMPEREALAASTCWRGPTVREHHDACSVSDALQPHTVLHPHRATMHTFVRARTTAGLHYCTPDY
jgi:hypothetical protein